MSFQDGFSANSIVRGKRLPPLSEEKCSALRAGAARIFFPVALLLALLLLPAGFSQDVSQQQTTTFVATPHTAPGLNVPLTTICTKPGLAADFGISLTQPKGGFAAYELRVSPLPASSGFVVLDPSSGQEALAAGLLTQPGEEETQQFVFRSIAGQPVQDMELRVSNASFGVDLRKALSHKLVAGATLPFAPKPGQGYAVSSELTEWQYRLGFTNDLPEGCLPDSFFIVKEAPATSGWDVWFTDKDPAKDLRALNVSAGKSIDVSLFAQPQAVPGIGKYRIYAVASDQLPSRLGEESDYVAAASDATGIWAVTEGAKLRLADARSGAIIREHGIGSSPRAVALDDTHVYWMAGGRISRSPKGSFTPADVALVGTGAAGLTVDGQFVYWIEGNRIKRSSKVPTAGSVAACSGAACSFLEVSGAAPLDVTTDANFVYWSDGSAIWKIPKIGGSPSVAFDGKAGVNSLSSEGTSLYASFDRPGGFSKVGRVATSGGPDDPHSITGGPSDFLYTAGRNAIADLSAGGGRLAWVEAKGLFTLPIDILASWAVVIYEYRPDAPSLVIAPESALGGGGETSRHTIMLTNKAQIPVTYAIALDSPPAGWAASVSTTSLSLGPGGRANFTVVVTSPTTARPGDSWAWCVNASGGGLFGKGCSSFTVSVHNTPSVSATLLAESPMPRGPGEIAGWQLEVRNNDPAEFVQASKIKLTAMPPPGWKVWFQAGENLTRFEQAEVIVGPQTTDTSLRLFVQSSRGSPDGTYDTTLFASIENQFSTTPVAYTVRGCGNGVCEIERGERNRDTGLWCPADCALGFDEFKCVFFGTTDNLTWQACSRTEQNSTAFGVETAVPQINELSNVQLRACKRGSAPEACLAASCGLTATEGFAASLSDCVASLGITQPGVVGPRWDGRLACPTDFNGEFYFNLQGERVSVRQLQPVRETVAFSSANFTFACPAYNLAELSSIASRWNAILGECPARLDNLRAIGARVCADQLRLVCGWRADHVRSIQDVLQKPNAALAENLRNMTAILERQIEARLQTQCFGIPGLVIGDIVPPAEGSQVGESVNVLVPVNNTFFEDYRGYASCELTLPDGSNLTARSGCILYEKSKTIAAGVPVQLALEGQWKVNSCTVYGDLAEALPESRCFEAPEFAIKSPGPSFNIIPTNITFISPLRGATVAGTTPISAEVSGTFSSVGWATSRTSGRCSGAPLTTLVPGGEGFTQSYVGQWDTLASQEGLQWLCIIGQAQGFSALLGSIQVTVDNFKFLLNPTGSNVAARPGATRTLRATLKNLGPSDGFAITCSADWQGTVTAFGQTRSCGDSVFGNIAQGGEAEIMLKLTVPSLPTGSQSSAIVLATNSKGEEATASWAVRVSTADNNAPELLAANVSPTTGEAGETFTFKAQVSDPDGDSIASVQACLDAACGQKLCSMAQAQGAWTCASKVGAPAGVREWFVQATDSGGLAASLKGPDFVIQGEVEPAKCDFACLASCVSAPESCTERTNFGQRTCTAGTVCCKESPLPACTPKTGCNVRLERATCIWDPVARNYSVTAQAVWGGGAYTRINIEGQSSPRITGGTAVFTSRENSLGAKDVSASVYTEFGATVCTNTTSTTCLPPGTEPDRGLRADALPIARADASTFEVGATAAKAIDRSQFTAWKARPGLPQFIKLDLGAVKSVGGIGIYATSGKPTGFSIRTSTDDKIYSTAATLRNAAYSQDWNVTRFSARDSRYIRIDIDAAQGLPVQINEIEVYPAAAVGPPTAPPAGEFPLLPVIAIVTLAVIGAIAFLKRTQIKLYWQYLRAR